MEVSQWEKKEQLDSSSWQAFFLVLPLKNVVCVNVKVSLEDDQRVPSDPHFLFCLVLYVGLFT